MELKEIINNLNFPSQYQNYIRKMDLSKSNDFVKAMLNSMITKYGKETLKSEIEIDSSNSKISSHLTHIIEVGGLKIISDNGLDSVEKSDFKNMIVSVVFVLNCSLAIELNNLNVYTGNRTNYYNNESIKEIASRLGNSTIQGMQYSGGFEDYSNRMIINNLISQFSIA